MEPHQAGGIHLGQGFLGRLPRLFVLVRVQERGTHGFHRPRRGLCDGQQTTGFSDQPLDEAMDFLANLGGVNIVDMALSPAADMRSGAISLWVPGEESAKKTEDLITELGFPVARV